MLTRIANIGKWLGLMIESIVFICVPSEIMLPMSTHLIMNTSDIDLDSLSFRERSEVSNYVILTGLASISAFLGFGFGLLGKVAPIDVFNKDGDNPLNIIIHRRRKNNCSICLENFKLSQDIHVTKCGHPFHAKCFHKWSRVSDTCPTCRQSCV